MAAYRRVYDSHHLQADCQEPESAPEPYARRPNRVWAIITFYVIVDKSMCFIVIRLIATLLYDYYTVSACIKCLKLS